MASNRGDILQTSSKVFSRLLDSNIFLLVVLFTLNFLLLFAEWRFNIVTNPKDSVKFVAALIGVTEFVLLSLCYSKNHTSTVTANLKFSHRLSNLVKAFCIFLFSCIAFHAVTVLYGAPAFEAVEETFLFSLLVSTLSILPCLMVIGTSSSAWGRLYFDRKPEDEAETCLLCLVVCTYLGAWFGAFPIPLDWDRPWQAWPITVCVGALWGHTVGVFVSISQLLYKMSDQNQQGKLS